MASNAINLPEGFVLDQPNPISIIPPKEVNLPQGFVLDTELTQEPTRGGIFGEVPESQYQAGERNILGNVFERPAAAVRSAIQGKGYAQGAINPTNVPTFQDLALDKYYKSKTGDILGQATAKGTKILSRQLTGQKIPISKEMGKIPAGMLVSGAGAAADTLTDPTAWLATLAGYMPMGSGRILGTVIKNSKVGQALSRIGNTPIETMASKLNRQSLNRVIDYGINKAVRPTVVGKGTIAGRTQYADKARTVVKTIVENKNILNLQDQYGQVANRLPESLDDFAQAIQQIKIYIFNQYDAIRRAAQRAGAKINLKPIIDELRRVSKTKVIIDNRPEVANYAGQLADNLSRRKFYTPKQAQDAIKLYNTSLEGYYKNPTFAEANKATIDSNVAKKLRVLLDDIIENATGKEYQPLKNKYAALKSLEADVNKRAVVYGRQNAKGLVDMLGDIAGGGDMVQGLLSLNPAKFAGGIAKKGIAAYIKALVNPDNVIKDMFKKVNKLHKF